MEPSDSWEASSRSEFTNILRTRRFTSVYTRARIESQIILSIPPRSISQSIFLYLPQHKGRAIAQEVSRRLPTAAARVRAQVRSCGICGGQSGTGACFLRVLRFLLPILIPPIAPHSSSIIRGWYNRSINGQRTKWTQSHPTPKKLKKTT
jgi:hypothetical protein